MSVREAIKELADDFQAAGIHDPRMEASLLVAFALGLDHARLRLLADRPLSTAESARLAILAHRRLAHEPLQYILGEWPFLDLNLEVTPAALIPRPETEEWVHPLLTKLIPRHFGSGNLGLFADICTGNGAIGLALALDLPKSRGVLTDLSPAALALAHRNLDRYPTAASRLTLLCGDLLSPLASGAFDLIASNPPYVASSDIPNLMPEVRDHEPRLALDGGPAGETVIARLLADAGRVLKHRGLLIIEHGHGQRANLQKLPAPDLSLLEAGNDAAGRERFIAWQRL